MSSPQHYRQLSLPTGTETLQLHEAARHRRITRTLEDLFSLWGYDPAETALVDYFDVYRRLLSDEDVRQMYRAVDRQGEILALRADTTLFLAKQLGLHLTSDDLPVRVFYTDQIVRAEDRHDISNNEYQQAGIELVGLAHNEGDAEVLFLAVEALQALGLTDAVIHVGSHALVTACANEAGLDTATVADLLRRRAFHDPILQELDAPLQRLTAFIGGRADFETVRDELGSESTEISTTSDELIRVVSLLEAIIPVEWRNRIRIDVSELGAYHYYTGIAFSAYIPDSNAAVLRGGRYDRLLEAFGFDAPSVGFSLFTRKLPAAVFGGDDPPVNVEFARGATLAERVADARQRHTTRKRVHL
ncbi:MAG: ATP phosphoribosyltransferase regulatory subunit [Alkalispirochaeta sp.]